MDWSHVKPLESEDLIPEFEQFVDFRFPEDFKAAVKKYNGGRPSLDVFSTEKSKARVMKALLSFNHEDRENAWEIRSWDEALYVAFAIDPFGNLLCFDTSTKHIILLNHEDSSAEYVASSFTEFLGMLRAGF